MTQSREKPSPPARPAKRQPKIDSRVPGERRVLIACMPKSGSTFLSKTLESLPGFRRARLVPGYQRREQELCIDRLNAEIGISEKLIAEGTTLSRGYVAQHHIRFSGPTDAIMREYRIVPIVLVRNLFDIVQSLRDHLADTAPYMSMAYVSEEMRHWPEEQMHRFLADMAMPWYFNFFRSWQDCPDKLLISYEELMADKPAALRRICDHAGIELSEDDIIGALGAEPKGGTRLNKGVSGRGEALAPEVKDRIRHFAKYYTDIDCSILGV